MLIMLLSILLAIGLWLPIYFAIDCLVERYQYKRQLSRQREAMAKDLVSRMLLDSINLNDNAFEARKALIRASSEHSREVWRR